MKLTFISLLYPWLVFPLLILLLLLLFPPIVSAKTLLFILWCLCAHTTQHIFEDNHRIRKQIRVRSGNTNLMLVNSFVSFAYKCHQCLQKHGTLNHIKFQFFYPDQVSKLKAWFPNYTFIYLQTVFQVILQSHPNFFISFFLCLLS